MSVRLSLCFEFILGLTGRYAAFWSVNAVYLPERLQNVGAISCHLSFRDKISYTHDILNSVCLKLCVCMCVCVCVLLCRGLCVRTFVRACVHACIHGSV